MLRLSPHAATLTGSPRSDSGPLHTIHGQKEIEGGADPVSPAAACAPRGGAEPSRAERSRADPGGAEPGRAELNGAEARGAEPSPAESCQGEPSPAERSRAPRELSGRRANKRGWRSGGRRKAGPRARATGEGTWRGREGGGNWGRCPQSWSHGSPAMVTRRNWGAGGRRRL